ncbi:MAG: MBL fold metallo-hydrolase [Bacteroidales bacterium]|nr:MBL fold metallo-hydrolase [Candidatus Sodaliphilus fimicaballi]
MKITPMTFNPFGVYTYVLWHEEGKEAYVVDPGMMDDFERGIFSSFIESHNLNLTKVLLTHLHIDHVMGAQWVADKYNASIEYNSKDDILSSRLTDQAIMFGLNIRIDKLNADVNLKEGDLVMLNGEPIKVLETPGHSLGSLSFYIPESGKLLSGDAIFSMSIGRTDLPGGNYDQLITSINEKIMTLPAGTVIYPGHGDCTTVKDEKMYNPFLK